MAKKYTKKKYSLNDRISYYAKRCDSKHSGKAAFSFGFVDGATLSRVDSSFFTTDKQKEAYHKGVSRGQDAYKKSQDVKF